MLFYFMQHTRKQNVLRVKKKRLHDNHDFSSPIIKKKALFILIITSKRMSTLVKQVQLLCYIVPHL